MNKATTDLDRTDVHLQYVLSIAQNDHWMSGFHSRALGICVHFRLGGGPLGSLLSELIAAQVMGLHDQADLCLLCCLQWNERLCKARHLTA